MKIKYTDVFEYDTHKFCAFASDLELAPGEVPHILPTDVGNKNPFRLVRWDSEGYFLYKQSYGCVELKVWND